MLSMTSARLRHVLAPSWYRARSGSIRWFLHFIVACLVLVLAGSVYGMLLAASGESLVAMAGFYFAAALWAPGFFVIRHTLWFVSPHGLTIVVMALLVNASFYATGLRSLARWRATRARRGFPGIGEQRQGSGEARPTDAPPP